MAIKAIMTFLQSKGVDTTDLNEDHFKKYLTGTTLATPGTSHQQDSPTALLQCRCRAKLEA